MRRPALAVLLAVLGLAIACDSGDDGGGGAAAGICPASTPAEGTACATDLTVCELGSDPSFRCTVRSVCRDGAWRTFTADTTICPSNPDTCPISWADANEKPCARQYELCTFSTGVCQCTKADGGFVWACKDLPGNCPNDRPRAGTACDQDAGRCPYPDCAMVCTSGIWQPDRVCQRAFDL
jgi:hypothetical protein